MEIIRGSLDSVARPASGELTAGGRTSSVTSSRPDRHNTTKQFALVVLTKDAPQQNQSIPKEQASLKPSDTDSVKDLDQIESNEGNNEDVKLQKAIEEMRRLDEVLLEKTCKEKEIQRQRKDLRAKLWKELLHHKPEGHSESPHEALNTRLFLELEPPSGAEDEDCIAVCFETESPMIDRHSRYEMHGGTMSDSLTESYKLSIYRATKSLDKQKDSISRNSELVSEDEGQLILTLEEKKRLALLLQEIEEETEEGASKFDSEQQNQCGDPSRSSTKAFNPRMSLALGASTAQEDKYITPLFETEFPEGQHDNYSVFTENGRRRSDRLTESCAFSFKDAGGPFRPSKSKNKQKDFVRRNIEMISEQGGQVDLTQAEQKRLAELLQEEEEEEENIDAFTEDTPWAVPVLSGQGYTPEPSDLEQLIDIDSKIRPFLSNEEFKSLQGSFTNLSLSQVYRQPNQCSHNRKQIQPAKDSSPVLSELQ